MKKKLGPNVEFVDLGLSELIKSLKRLEKMDVLVGYVGDNGAKMHPNASVSIAQIAAMQEFGTDDIPARSFMRSTMVEQQSTISDLWALAVKNIVEEGMEPEKALSEVGLSVSKLMKDKLKRASSWAKPLEEDTVTAKGSNIPLKDSGALLENLGWAVTFNNTIVKQGRAP